MALDQLRITEIFNSLQGETLSVGLPTVFIRLTGCPLRCAYCDTAYAFSGGELRTIESIIVEVKQYASRYITVTGGEPLAQQNVLTLLERLCDLNYQVSLETSGAIDIVNVDRRVITILDLKTPASDECHRNLYENIDHLKQQDQIKFVICNRQDYDWAKMKIDQYRLSDRVDEVLFSPSHDELAGQKLAEWILEDGLHVRFQLQLHKYLWSNDPGH